MARHAPVGISYGLQRQVALAVFGCFVFGLDHGAGGGDGVVGLHGDELDAGGRAAGFADAVGVGSGGAQGRPEVSPWSIFQGDGAMCPLGEIG